MTAKPRKAKARRRKAKARPKSRTFRFTPTLIATATAHAGKTGLTINKLIELAAEVGFSAQDGHRIVLPRFVALLRAAAANHAADKKAKRLTAATARAMREATKRLRAATGEPTPPEPAASQQRQSA